MELDNPIVLAFVAFVLFAICLYLVERVEGIVGLRLPRFLRVALAIILVFLGYQAWQGLPLGYIPQFDSSENRSVTYFLPPISDRDCPSTHPVKADFTTSRGGRCIYRVPESEFYSKTKPARCYSTVEDAEQNGCKASNF